MKDIHSNITCTRCGKDILYCTCENSPKKQVENLQKENAELKAELETAQECIVQQQKEYEKLDKQYTEWFCKYHEQIVTVSELKARIEKMKCCENCKCHTFWGDELKCKRVEYDCKNLDKWELAE